MPRLARTAFMSLDRRGFLGLGLAGGAGLLLGGMPLRAGGSARPLVLEKKAAR